MKRAERAAEAARARVAAMLRAELPDAAVRVEGERVVVEGRGISRAPVLRWVAGGLK